MNDTSAPVTRAQHLIPACVILALSISVAWLSFTREPSEAFLFSRFIGSAMLLLAVWNFVRAYLGMARIGDGLEKKAVLNFLPGLVLIGVFVLFAAKYLGFYAASYVAFLGIYSLYDPASHTDIKSWIKRLLVTSGFMAVIYALFTLLLKVQTPRGLFF
jgi:hypothetical protein